MNEQPVRIFIIKYGRSNHLTGLLTTAHTMNFVRAFEFYEKRYQCTKKRHLNPMDLHMNLVNEE